MNDTTTIQVCEHCLRTGKLVQMAADDAVFVGSDGTWCVLLSDVFSYASADAEPIADEDVEPLYHLWMEHGSLGAIAWVAGKRGEEPMHHLVREMRKQGVPLLWTRAE